MQPAKLVVLSFGLVIVTGTALLSLPQATRPGSSIRLIDAFFMATSATCVTGLSVIDIFSAFSTFGQLVILSCIQMGGLGLMTLTTVFLVASGRRLAIADRVAIQESFHHSPTGRLKTLILYIVVATFATEATGATILATYWIHGGVFASPGEAIYHAIFHAVSAFCNAGFALYPNNLMRFQSDWVVQFVIMGLIIAGGLGFLVGLDLKEYIEQRLFRDFWSQRVRKRVESIRPAPRLSVHTKFVLTVTAALLVVGTVSYYLLERERLFRGMSTGEAWLNAWFCSVTARTAGFNTIDYAQMSGAALLCTMVLMFIGASPGSTGGGVKTSTFGILLAYGLSRWRSQSGVHAFRRTIPQENVDRAASVMISAVAVVILAASFLMGIETLTLDPTESQSKFLSVLFETFSAFGTVGFSLGLTPTLSSTGKLAVCILMFVGRTGPLTLALALASRRRLPQYSYAEENVMVG
jgi:trk system potassium uptake protein TrkH